jgi:hypothetical protein
MADLGDRSREFSAYRTPHLFCAPTVRRSSDLMKIRNEGHLGCQIGPRGTAPATLVEGQAHPRHRPRNGTLTRAANIPGVRRDDGEEIIFGCWQQGHCYCYNLQLASLR